MEQSCAWMENRLACLPDPSIKERPRAPNDVERTKRGLQAFQRKVGNLEAEQEVNEVDEKRAKFNKSYSPVSYLEVGR